MRDDDFDPREELAPEERWETERLRSQSVPRRKLFPSVDEDGYDREGYAWGASPDGRAR